MASIKQLLIELIKIPSYFDAKEKADERELCEYVYSFFQNLERKDAHLHVEKQPVEADRFNIIVRKGEPKILLGFHLDTVHPNPKDWKVCKPFEPKIIEDRLYGRGAIDMKASIATIMALTEERLPELNNFCFLFTVDEEYNFKGINKFLDSVKTVPQLVVFCEPTDLKISNKHRGIMQLCVTAYGKSAHAGTPRAGINAIEILVLALNAVGKEVMSEKFADPSLGNCAFNLAYSVGGLKGSYNYVPDQIMAVLDVRPTPRLHAKLLEKLIKKEVEKKFKQKCLEYGLDYKKLFREPEIKFDFVYGPLQTDPKDLKKLESAIQKTIGYAAYTMSFGITEAGLLAERLKVPACNFGPSPSNMSHKPDEYVNLNDLEKIKKVYETLLIA